MIHAPRFSFVRPGALAWLPACALAAAACGPSPTVSDAGDAFDSTPLVDAVEIAPDAVDAVTDSCALSPRPAIAGVLPLTPRVALKTGATAEIEVRLTGDAVCEASYPVATDTPGVVMVPASVTAAPGAGTIAFGITATQAGTTTLTIGDGVSHATLAVSVTDTLQTSCDPANTPSTTGMLMPGGTLTGMAGTALAAASVTVPAGATTAPVQSVTLACAPDLTVSGYTAVGPPVSFAANATRYPRDIPFHVPFDPAAVPARDIAQVELAYTGPGVPAPVIVPVASVEWTHDANGDALAFEAPRLGTYRAVIRSDLGQRSVLRHLTHKAIMGISMGAAGASLIGTHHPELFDAIVPLGGPVEWGYVMQYVRTQALSGFCTAAQRAANPTGCGASDLHRNPPPIDQFEHASDFEHLYEEGPGGTSFDRTRYTDIFRDMARMFGNPLVAPGDTGFLPYGVPDTVLMQSDAQRCATPVTLHGFYDARFNPDGSLPVITFCDGNEDPMHEGVWDPMVPPTVPTEVSWAVDVNGNGRRDGGEPVVIQSTEPFDDVGLDGVADAMEPGYDPQRNPDPAGDDYDWQYNPNGTEGNGRLDPAVGLMPGETFQDVGLDGVAGTPQTSAGGYDTGEGNGRFDTASGFANFIAQNPLDHIDAMDDATVDRLASWDDGGVRDIVNFGTDEDHLVGALARRGVGLHLSNQFAPLVNGSVAEMSYDYTMPDWAHLPRHMMVRYGSLDATPDEILMGDGTHVGTQGQAVQRIESGLRFIGAQWPDADFHATAQRLPTTPASDCSTAYTCILTIHSAAANRDNPTLIFLPPGYHDAAHANERYPVIVMLHGYGDMATSLQGLSLLLYPAMSNPNGASWQRLPKAIIVFADGYCRPGDNCLLGTFFANGIPGSAQIESAVIDVLAYIDANFRTMGPTDVMATE